MADDDRVARALLEAAPRSKFGDVFGMPRNPARAPAIVEQLVADATVNPLWDVAKGIGATVSGHGNSPEAGAGLMAAMGLMSPMRAPLAAGLKPIRAYHGSPHDFNKFDISKIGTGEGHQAYGHGLYFAENPATAQTYKEGVYDKALINKNNKLMSDIVNEMNKYKSPGSGYRQFNDPRGYELAKEYDRLMEEKMKPGRMYEVNIHARPEQFLDWDKPLAGQNENARKQLSAIIASKNAGSGEGVGQYLYYDLAKALGGGKIDPAGASQAMRDAGIPGIKYLDSGSRFQPQQVEHLKNQISQLEAMPPSSPGVEQALAGRKAELAAIQPTSNYVLFQDNIIDIVKKYGWAGVATALGLDTSKMQPQPEPGI